MPKEVLGRRRMRQLVLQASSHSSYLVQNTPYHSTQANDAQGSDATALPTDQHCESHVDLQSASDEDSVPLASCSPNDESDESEKSDCDDSEDGDSDEQIYFDIKEELREWGKDVPHNKLTSLLKVLKKHRCFSSLPSDSRAILRRSEAPQIVSCSPGHLAYFGIKNFLLEIASERNFRNTGLVLNFNIDGLPAFKSNGSEFYPILCSEGEFKWDIGCVSLYYGSQKPNIEDFLRLFVEELNSLIRNGLEIEGFTYEVSVRSFVCDTPARSYVLCTKGHSGYSCCYQCTVEGENVNKRCVFSDINAPLRTDSSFRNQEDEEHHNNRSPLEEVLGIDMIKSFPLDYMHLVCLGVMKKMLNQWIMGKPGPWKLRGQKISQLSESLEKLGRETISEFARIVRGLADLCRWKATEFRNFLLYVGPVVLKEILTEEYYDHFLSLSVAISILISPELCQKYNEYAEQLLRHFVQYYGSLYGADKVSFNVHSLIHLASDVKHLGPLDNFSAFSFESHLGKIKRLIRSPHKPLQQVVNRIRESHLKKHVFQQKRFSKPRKRTFQLAHIPGKQYLKFSTDRFVLNLSMPKNSFAMLKDKRIVLVLEIYSKSQGEDGVIVFKNFEKVEDFYTRPCPSNKLSVFKISDLSSHVQSASTSFISKKCQAYTNRNGEVIAFALPHC